MRMRDPEQRTWEVSREWLPYLQGRGFRTRNAKWRSATGRDRPAGEHKRSDWWVDVIGVGDSPGWIFVAVVVVAVLVGLFLWGVPLLLALLDLLVVLLLASVGLFSHEVLRRPWTVTAIADDGTRLTRAVVGFRAAGRACTAWAEELRHGRGFEPPVV